MHHSGSGGEWIGLCDQGLTTKSTTFRRSKMKFAKVIHFYLFLVLLMGLSQCSHYPIEKIELLGANQVAVGKSLSLKIKVTLEDGETVTLDNKSCQGNKKICDRIDQLSSHNPYDLTWQSSDPTLAKIDNNGVLTGVAEGAVTVSLSVDQFSTSKQLMVTDLPEGVIRVHYHRFDNTDSEWGLYLWNRNNDSPAIDYEEAGAGDWNNPIKFDKIDSFGAYTDIPVIDIKNGLNLIVKKDDNKDGGDRYLSTAGETEFWMIENLENVFAIKPKSFSTVKEALHIDFNKISIEVSSHNNKINPDDIFILDQEGNRITIEDLSVIDNKVVITTKALDFTQNYTLKYNNIENYIYFSRELLNKEEFIYPRDDLGVRLSWTKRATFKVWSPPATSVQVEIFDKENPNQSIGVYPLKRGKYGVWSKKITPFHTGIWRGLDGYYYQYLVTAYGKTKRVLDPYAKSMAPFLGNYQHQDDYVGKGAIVNLRKRDSRTFRNSQIMANNVDLIAYEVHVRDFTIGDNSISEELRGTFPGFEKNRLSPRLRNNSRPAFAGSQPFSSK